MKYVFIRTLKKKTVITSFSLLSLLRMEGLLFSDPFKNGAYWKGVGAHLVGGIFCAQPLLPVLSLSIVIVSLFNIYF